MGCRVDQTCTTRSRTCPPTSRLAAIVAFVLLLPLYFSQRRDLERLTLGWSASPAIRRPTWPRARRSWTGPRPSSRRCSAPAGGTRPDAGGQRRPRSRPWWRPRRRRPPRRCRSAAGAAGDHRAPGPGADHDGAGRPAAASALAPAGGPHRSATGSRPRWRRPRWCSALLAIFGSGELLGGDGGPKHGPKPGAIVPGRRRGRGPQRNLGTGAGGEGGRRRAGERLQARHGHQQP